MKYGGHVFFEPVWPSSMIYEALEHLKTSMFLWWTSNQVLDFSIPYATQSICGTLEDEKFAEVEK